ncbi:MAG: DUF1634 domain-containing protein [Dissulfurispiraceae bacterium]|jgi:uncharacterized membrane protein
MKREAHDWTDAYVELVVGFFLRAGVIIAAAIVFAGGIFYLIKYGLDVPEYKIFSGEPTDLRSVHGILTDAVSLRSRGIIQFGLLLLMFTPVAWVSFLLFTFSKQRDRTYVIVTAIVLTILLFSLVGKYLYD